MDWVSACCMNFVKCIWGVYLVEGCIGLLQVINLRSIVGEWVINLWRMSSFLSSSTQPVSEILRSISTKRYMPLCFDGIHGFPNVIPNDVRDRLPKFNGNNLVSTSHHI